jgi:xylulokinase
MDWVTDLDDTLGPDRLPRLMWSTGIAGHVTPEAAAQTGLRPGTPVTCGTIDAAAEAVSVGVAAPGDMMMMYGSTIFIIAGDGRAGEGRAALVRALAGAGPARLHGWAGDIRHAHPLVPRPDGARPHPGRRPSRGWRRRPRASPPGANGLLWLPYFSGERTPIHDTHAKGAIFGLNLTHTRGDLYRALLEGIAMATAHVIETYRELGHAPARVLAVGGGTKNRLWLQATSDFGGVPQIVSEKTVGASYGDAFLAALAVGAVAPGDIARWNPAERVVEPQGGALHARQYGLFRRLYEQTKDIARDLG